MTRGERRLSRQRDTMQTAKQLEVAIDLIRLLISKGKNGASSDELEEIWAVTADAFEAAGDSDSAHYCRGASDIEPYTDAALASIAAKIYLVIESAV